MTVTSLARAFAPRSLRTRLTAAVSGVIAVIALFLYLYLPYRLHREAQTAIADKAQSIGQMTAFSISAAVVFEDSVGLEEALTIARQNADLAYISVVDEHGNVLANWEMAGIDSTSRMPDSWNFLEKSVYSVRTPVLSNGSTKGAVEIGLSMSAVHARIEASRRLTLLLSVIIFAFGAVAVLAISRLVTRPLDALIETVGHISAGDLSQRAPDDTSAEISRLVKAFNTMVDRLALAQSQLTGFNRELELRVEERTAVLLTTQTQLVSARDLAEAGSRAKSEFLANMSHEIRTPMNGVLGTLELARDTELSPLQREYLDLAHGSAEALLAIINDILDFSKIEAGMMALEPIAFNLQETVDAAVTSLALRAHTQGLELAVRLAPDVPEWITADPGRIRQVLMNLLGNAVKFTLSGEVVLSVVALPGSQLQFTVTDTGIGISEAKQRLVFEAFSQADASTTRQYGGTGLGLTISTQLVGLMGGRIWVESEAGKGSRFHFTIGYAPAVVPAEAAPGPPAILQGMPVLIVDDNATNRLILRDTLARWGMRPETAESATAALAIVEQRKVAGQAFSLFLLDVNMPGVDGFTLATRLRQVLGTSQATIMMLTSATRVTDIERCQALGITTHLCKPVRRSELEQAILAALSHGPTVAALPVRSSQAHRAIPSEAGPLRILLAEDNPVNQRVAMGFLTRQGHRVDVAENGRIAVEMWSRGQYDAILMDVQMPVMGGFEATRAIREIERTRGGRIPIAALTAHAMRGDRDACLAEGMDDYLTKPIQAAELTRVLRGISPCEPTPEQPGPAGPLDGDEELYREAGGAFLESYAECMNQTRTAVTGRSWPELKRAAHTWKGSIGYFGATVAMELARQLETSASNHDADGSEAVFAMLEPALNRLRTSLAIKLESHN